MSGPDLPEIPAPLKSIQHYLRIASSHDKRDRVISYWCRLYAMQTGLKLQTKTSEETAFLLKLMTWLEATQAELRDNEAITNDVAALAHLENWALKLFLYADKNDRASNFGKNVIQSFFTAGLLYDVCTLFGDLSEEASQNRKYAKWKAAYINNCLKNGETPIPGPVNEDDGQLNINQNSDEDIPAQPKSLSSTKGPFDFPSVPTDSSAKVSPPDSNNGPNLNLPTPNANPYNPAPTPTSLKSGGPSFDSEDYSATVKTEGGVALSMEQMTKAQKFIKWAGSALNYDDVPTAVNNLRKALHLLTTGEEIN